MPTARPCQTCDGKRRHADRLRKPQVCFNLGSATAGHGHHAEPVYEKVTGFQPSVDVPDLPEEDEKEPEEEKPAGDVPDGSGDGL